MIKSDIDLLRRKSTKRALVILCSFAIIACFLLFNVLRLDYFLYDYYKAKAFDQITTTSSMKAERGNIYDSNMNLLATTKTTWRVFVSTREIKTRAKKDGINYAQIISRGVCDILSLDYATTYKKIANSNVLDVTIKKSADESEYNKIVSFAKENQEMQQSQQLALTIEEEHPVAEEPQAEVVFEEGKQEAEEEQKADEPVQEVPVEESEA